MDVHDLTPAYALDALDDVERTEYEAHLAQCARCREELAQLSESAAALAWAVESPAPPAALRSRILAETAAGRENVVPLVRRRLWQGVSAVAACAAIGLGIWASTLRNDHAFSVAADRMVQLQGADGYVALTRTGMGVLVVKMAAAPAGQTYEAWVIPRGGSPQRAGTFDGGDGMTMLPLEMPVPNGAVVPATMERDGGVDAPTHKPMLSAQT